MKRLIKKANYFDVINKYDHGNRECALVYVNGEILEGYEHWPILKQYFLNKFSVDIENDDKISKEIDNFLSNKKSEQNLLMEYAVADKINDNDLGKTIMIFKLSINGISEDELFNKFKQKYPEYDILTDDDVVEILEDDL